MRPLGERAPRGDGWGLTEFPPRPGTLTATGGRHDCKMGAQRLSWTVLRCWPRVSGLARSVECAPSLPRLVCARVVSLFTLAAAEQAPTPPASAAPGQAVPAAPARGAGGGGPGQAAGSAATQNAGGQLIALVPKQVNPPRWVAPNKPWTKLADVLAAHKGQTDWTHRVVTDQALEADWISMGPGKKTPRRANDDTREWWIVWDGQMKFTIDGQEPFIAKKGYMVQVPYRNFYQSRRWATRRRCGSKSTWPTRPRSSRSTRPRRRATATRSSGRVLAAPRAPTTSAARCS